MTTSPCLLDSGMTLLICCMKLYIKTLLQDYLWQPQLTETVLKESWQRKVIPFGSLGCFQSCSLSTFVLNYCLLFVFS